MTASSEKLGYRPDIDGLRAIAVSSVLAFHFGAPIRGGFTGVDVFFVISGFLITQIMAREMSSGTFSVLGFYARRVRRILPAVLVMLAATLGFGVLTLLPGDYASLSSSNAMAAFGVSNFYFLLHTGYFDQLAELMPLLHTWSLAVEEQFYLVWPFVLFAVISRRNRRTTIAAVSSLVLLGYIGASIYFYIDDKAAFYLPLPRAWELGLGALLAFLPPLPASLSDRAPLVGLSLIAIGFIVISPTDFPGPAALLPCAGAALIIWPRAVDSITARRLGALAPIGLISYSLYLWHWPIWVYFRILINNGKPNVAEAFGLTIVSTVVAIFSYRYIEKPFRKLRQGNARTVAVGIACAFTLFCASTYVNYADGFPGRVPAEAQAMRSRDVMWEWPCKTSTIEGISDLCVFGAPWATASRKTMIWGDSHAEHYAPILDAISTDPGRSYLVFAGCSAVLGDDYYIVSDGVPGYVERCKRFHAKAIALLTRDDKIDRVVITSNWLDLPIRIGRGDRQAGLHAMQNALDKITMSSFLPGRRFLVIGAEPELPQTVVECAHARSTRLLRAPCSTTVNGAALEKIRRTAAPIDAMFAEVAKMHPNVDTIFPTRTLCGKDACQVYLDGEFLYEDVGHIRRNLRLQTKRDFAAAIGLPAVLAGDRRTHDVAGTEGRPITDE